MATCSFIKERKQTAGSMGRVIQYVSQPKKTVDEDGNRYLTGVNCVADVAMQSWVAGYNRHRKGEVYVFRKPENTSQTKRIDTRSLGYKTSYNPSDHFKMGKRSLCS